MNTRLLVPLSHTRYEGTGSTQVSSDPQLQPACIHFHICPGTGTALQRAQALTFGPAHPHSCIVLCNCHLIEARECRATVYSLNYARLDLLHGKYLACLPSVVRSAVRSCYHTASHSSAVCSRVQAAAGNFPAHPCEQSALPSLLAPHSFHEIIITANPHGTRALYHVLFQVPYVCGSDIPSRPGRGCFYFYNECDDF